MSSYCEKRVKKFVGFMTRSRSPVFYRIYTHSKGFYLICWACWNWEDRPTQYVRFNIFFPKREIVRILRALNQPNCVIVDTDFLPHDFAGFDSIKALSVRKQEGITPQGKHISSWMVLTKMEDEYGVNYSHPYSNCFPTQAQAFRRADEMLQLVKQVNPKIEVILESPVNGNDFWRNLNETRKIAYEQAGQAGEGAPSVQTS